ELGEVLQAEGAKPVAERQQNHRADVGDGQNEKAHAASEEAADDHDCDQGDDDHQNEEGIKKKAARVSPMEGQEFSPGLSAAEVVFVHHGHDEMVEEQFDITEGQKDEQQEDDPEHQR